MNANYTDETVRVQMAVRFHVEEHPDEVMELVWVDWPPDTPRIEIQVDALETAIERTPYTHAETRSITVEQKR